MIVILLVSIAGAAMVGLAKQQAYSVSKVKDYLTAQSYAEAGASEAYSLLKTDFAARNDPTKFPARTFGDGSYDADVQPVGDNMAVITCVGTRGTATAEVKLDIVNNAVATGGAGGTPPTSPWAYGVFVNGVLDHNGTGTQTGNTHVNGNLISSGGGGLEWGEAGHPVTVSVCGPEGSSFAGGGVIYGTLKTVTLPKKTPEECTVILGPVPTIPLPDISAKLTEYYNIALANGQVFNTAPENIVGSVSGGVRWYNCAGGISPKNVNYAGAVICTGPITFQGGFSNTRVGDLPAVVSRDGSLTCKGAHDVNGLVYAKGDILWNGAGSIVGALISGGNVRFNGAYGNLAYAYSEPGNAGGGGTSGSAANKVGVSAWQK